MDFIHFGTFNCWSTESTSAVIVLIIWCGFLLKFTMKHPHRRKLMLRIRIYVFKLEGISGIGPTIFLLRLFLVQEFVNCAVSIIVFTIAIGVFR